MNAVAAVRVKEPLTVTAIIAGIQD